MKYLYEFKYEAYMNFYKIYEINKDVLEGSLFSSHFNKIKRTFEEELNTIESKLLSDNEENCKSICYKLLNENYSKLTAELNLLKQKVNKVEDSSILNDEGVLKEFTSYYIEYALIL